LDPDPRGPSINGSYGSRTLYPTVVDGILPPAPGVVGGVLIIRDLCRHVELGIVDGGLVQRGGAHTVPRHVARQAQSAGRAQHGAAAGPPAPAIRAQILSLKAVLRIRICFNADPDPAFFVKRIRIQIQGFDAQKLEKIYS
jgi:hypothetical protein